jgi:transposase
MEKFTSVYDRWRGRELTQADAAEILGKSERQFRRYIDRYDSDGLDGLRDGRLGRVSEKAIPEDAVERLLALYRKTYHGWNMTHFHEHLVRDHGFTLSYSCMRHHLQAADLVRPERRPGGHRRKRERKPCVGMMLHQDGSRHAWLAGQPAMDLIVTMDDATSEITSAFLVEEEGTMSTFQGLLETCGLRGLPSSLYTDRGSHYFFTPEAGQKVSKTHLTQVGRALKALGIQHIAAYSPEARGRSERMFDTLQDRLLKELALAGITQVGAANAWIAATYLPRHNCSSLVVTPALPDSAFVSVETSRLTEALCIEEERTVGRDNTIAWEGRRLQIPESPMRRHYVDARVKVHAYPDGRLAILHGPRVIGRYTDKGEPVIEAPVRTAQDPSKVTASPSVASRSPPSRHGLDASPPVEKVERRPASTGSRRDAQDLACRKAKRCAA